MTTATTIPGLTPMHEDEAASIVAEAIRRYVSGETLADELTEELRRATGEAIPEDPVLQVDARPLDGPRVLWAIPRWLFQELIAEVAQMVRSDAVEGRLSRLAPIQMAAELLEKTTVPAGEGFAWVSLFTTWTDHEPEKAAYRVWRLPVRALRLVPNPKETTRP
jgi:hypothetical protein